MPQQQLEHNAPTGDSAAPAPVAAAGGGGGGVKDGSATSNGVTQKDDASVDSDVTQARAGTDVIPDVLVSELLSDIKEAVADVIIRSRSVEANVALVLERLDLLKRLETDFPVRFSAINYHPLFAIRLSSFNMPIE